MMESNPSVLPQFSTPQPWPSHPDKLRHQGFVPLSHHVEKFPDGLLTLVCVLPEHSQPLGVVVTLNVRPRAPPFLIKSVVEAAVLSHKVP